MHFGLQVRSGRKYGLRLRRDEYAPINKRSSLYEAQEFTSPTSRELTDRYFEDEERRIYTDEYCEFMRDCALRNFDLNIAHFGRLDRANFETALENLRTQFPDFKEVHDLNDWAGVGGLYVMVLDDYCQAYIGVSSDVRRRIPEHWRASKELDRLIWGTVETSILSVDSFRAFDTTRIFAAQNRSPYPLEERIVATFPKEFLINRLAGGRMPADMTLLDVVARTRTRELVGDLRRGGAANATHT